MKVYLLWWHREEGPEELKATLNPDKLPEMVKSYDNGWFQRVSTDPVEELKGINLEEAGVFSLMDGWGGLCLQIVELDSLEC